ncbi:MAG: GNAT family N-acetyltransferase [Acidobacteriaceae bacterium]
MNPADRENGEAQVSIRVCSTLDDARACVELQRAIWHDSEEDLTPSAIFIVAAKIGGQTLLARDGSRPVGFAIAFPAFGEDDARYLHSHIVGILPEYQNRGLGRLLKLKQREMALAAGISRMEWTFDPLALRNAYFNVVRLGATMRRSYLNLYGTTQSPLHSGLPTDRLVAEWRFGSKRVENALAGKPWAAAPDAIQIIVPAETESWRNSGSPKAAEVQIRLMTEFRSRFAEGFAVTGFRIENGNGVYLLDSQKQ